MKTIKRTLRYIKKHIGLMILSMILAAISALSALFIPIYIGRAIDMLSEVEKETVSSTFVGLAVIVVILVKAGVAVLISALCQQLMSVINNKVTYRVVRDIRNEAFSKIQKLPLKYLDSYIH